MPELPEVETCRRALDPLVFGRRWGAYQCSDRALRLQPKPCEMEALEGQTVSGLTRRGKYLVFHLSSHCVLVHLGMTGQIFVSPEAEPWLKHEHWRVRLSDGFLRYQDPRRFGMLSCCSSSALEHHPLLRVLGPDPVHPGAWTLDDFVAACQRSKKPIKHLIMDASCVVGVGNIYAAEALFAAGLHPRRRADQISRKRLALLQKEIRAVLARALAAGGSTIRDFRSSSGAPGYFAQELSVYGRGGAPCPRCSQALKSIVTGGRATVYCGRCQR